MTLQELSEQLEQFGNGELTLAQLHEWFHPILGADSLDVEESDEAPWVHAAEETRLFWRLVYLFESWDDEEALRLVARRVLACLASTRDAALAYELLPLILDQDRLAMIIEKHLGGTISRTSFLSVVAESGYPVPREALARAGDRDGPVRAGPAHGRRAICGGGADAGGTAGVTSYGWARQGDALPSLRHHSRNTREDG